MSRGLKLTPMQRAFVTNNVVYGANWTEAEK